MGFLLLFFRLKIVWNIMKPWMPAHTKNDYEAFLTLVEGIVELAFSPTGLLWGWIVKGLGDFIGDEVMPEKQRTSLYFHQLSAKSSPRLELEK